MENLFELDHTSDLYILLRKHRDWAVLAVVIDLLNFDPELYAPYEVRPTGELVIALQVDVKTDPTEIRVSYRVSLSHSLPGKRVSNISLQYCHLSSPPVLKSFSQ